jgi:hypothetical protein
MDPVLTGQPTVLSPQAITTVSDGRTVYDL